MAQRHSPDFTYEAEARALGHRHIAGVDEVGRGPLAGPVIAAAVILDPEAIPAGLADSKALSAKRRENLFDTLMDKARVGIGAASVEEIDTINILRASHLAMERALSDLVTRSGLAADFALIDGNLLPRGLTLSARAVVKGDARVLSIAAASIIAKVSRDRLMVDLAQQCPGYGWERNAGYPTAEHLARLKSHGVTTHHRRSFAPVHNILWQANSISG